VVLKYKKIQKCISPRENFNFVTKISRIFRDTKFREIKQNYFVKYKINILRNFATEISSTTLPGGLRPWTKEQRPKKHLKLVVVFILIKNTRGLIRIPGGQRLWTKEQRPEKTYTLPVVKGHSPEKYGEISIGR
jgi:hypothetical protein